MILLYGAGGHAKVIRDIIIHLGKKISKIVDDKKAGSTFYDLPILKSTEITVEDRVIISIGDNEIRKKITISLLSTTFSKALVHSSAVMGSGIVIGVGTVVMPKAVVNSGTSVGNHCIVNTNVIIEHDCVVEDFVHLSPGAIVTGSVRIGEGTHIGAGAIILPGLFIGKWCKIGAGAVVISNVEDGTTVVGNPAKIIMKKNE